MMICREVIRVVGHKYAGVIFDMDGLMFDTEPIWAHSWAPVLEKYGLKMKPEVFELALGSGRDALPNVLERVYGPRDDYVQIVDEHYALAYKLLDGYVPAKPGLDKLLELLSKRNIPCAVASSSPQRMVDHHLKLHGLCGYFKCIVDGTQVKHSKPAPDIFLLAAQRLEVKPHDALVLEDSFNGVRAAAAGGFPCYMVPDKQKPTPEIEALATGVYQSLTDVLKSFLV